MHISQFTNLFYLWVLEIRQKMALKALFPCIHATIYIHTPLSSVRLQWHVSTFSLRFHVFTQESEYGCRFKMCIPHIHLSIHPLVHWLEWEATSRRHKRQHTTRCACVVHAKQTAKSNRETILRLTHVTRRESNRDSKKKNATNMCMSHIYYVCSYRVVHVVCEEHHSEGVRTLKPKQHVHSCLLTQNVCKHIAIRSAREAFSHSIRPKLKRDNIHTFQSVRRIRRFAKRFWMSAV